MHLYRTAYDLVGELVDGGPVSQHACDLAKHGHTQKSRIRAECSSRRRSNCQRRRLLVVNFSLWDLCASVREDSRVRPAGMRSALHLGIDAIAQAVAEEV